MISRTASAAAEPMAERRISRAVRQCYVPPHAGCVLYRSGIDRGARRAGTERDRRDDDRARPRLRDLRHRPPLLRGDGAAPEGVSRARDRRPCGRSGRRFRAGDGVVIEPLLSCGACARCRGGEPNLCPEIRVLGSMAPGGFAEMVEVPARLLYRVPPGLDLDLAMLAEPLAVGVHAAHLADIGVGDEVLVLGAGAIGLLAAYAALVRGARVTVSARHPHQAAAARALGAGVVGAASTEILARQASTPPDTVLESVGGDADTLDLALDIVRAGGLIVALGLFTRPVTLAPLRFLMKEVRIVSSMTYCRRLARPDFETALAMLARDAARLRQLITHRVPLAEAARAFALAADKSSGAIKVAVVP